MKKLTCLFIGILFQTLSFGQINDSLLRPSLKLDLVLIDMPYQVDAGKAVNNGDLTLNSFFKGFANPSMTQSLLVTSDLYSSAHFGIDKLFNVQNNYGKTKNKLLHITSIIVTDFVLTFAPIGDGWLHEEYHRAVMSRFHVNSFNDMNKFPIGASSVSVNHVKDDDLIRFKSESPNDFIRMHVAGIEGEYLLIDNLQKNNFFYNQHITHEIMYLLTTLNSINYVNACSNAHFVNDETDSMNDKEDKISDRDFTGFDFTAWAYDLFNPDEPYEERGIHPSGTGIDRYIKTTDLSSDALNYLKKQGRLQWLNLISPMLFFKKSIRINHKYEFNFAVRHLLTSFGNDISMNAFLKINHENVIIRYHHANNFETSFPAMEIELLEHSLSYMNHSFLFSSNIIAGTQPKDQSFFTKDSEFIGYAGCRIDWIHNKLCPWIEIGAKTDGWIAGNEFLNSNISFRFGLSKRF